MFFDEEAAVKYFCRMSCRSVQSRSRMLHCQWSVTSGHSCWLVLDDDRTMMSRTVTLSIFAASNSASHMTNILARLTLTGTLPFCDVA